MKARPTDNPPNRFRDVAVSYDPGDGPPPSDITLIEDHSRSILSHNDSDDLDFRWSANPYRGCLSGCSYCISGDTPILLADGRTREIRDLRVDDEIYGTRVDGTRRYYVRTRVLDHWKTLKLAYRVTLADSTTLVASGDHRFLTERGWKHVRPVDGFGLSPENVLVGPGRVIPRFDDVANQRPELRVARVERLAEQELFDITTGTGDFIANGVVSHNCYARPTHEYLDMGAGTDFDTKIVIKPKAAELLREAFDKPSWKGEMVMFSGVTDCYQPIESKLRLTRQCLEVCLEYRNPVAVISKHALVERDINLFKALAEEAGFHLSVSLAFVDDELSRKIEPWAAAPSRRLKVIETMAKAGVPVGVMCAPVMPGLNDDQMIRVLERAAEAGATSAGWSLLRLPGIVKEVFEERVRVALPLAADKILHRIRETRGGKLYDARFGVRGRGEGVYAETLGMLFDTTVRRLGLNAREDDREFVSRFRRPKSQLSLFDD